MVIKLDADQAKVVAWKEGPVLVNAGPGSGKTRVVVERIKKLTEHVHPATILATTFTKKAAEEMQQRLHNCRSARGVQVRTTHSYAYKLLKAQPEFVEWGIDEDDTAKTILKKILGYRGMRWKVDITLVLSYIATMRAKLLSPYEAEQKGHPELFTEAYCRYNVELEIARLLTFDDMLYYGTRLLLENEEVRKREQKQYSYVIVDEAQDCNYAQITLASTIASPEFNLMLVGDVDQAIYAWRGAMPEYFVEFPTKYSATVFDLGKNYRCPALIVEKASRLIAHNERRFSKRLVSKRKEDGTLSVLRNEDANSQARQIGEIILSSLSPWKEHAILLRMNSHTRAFEEEFPVMKIPFVIWGDSSFYLRREVVDLLAYLRVVVSPEDHRSGARALQRPFRFISVEVMSRIVERSHRTGFFEAVKHEMIHNSSYGLKSFLSLFEGIDRNTRPSEFLRMIVLMYIPYLEEYEGKDTIETSRVANALELIQCAERFQTIHEFLRFVDTTLANRKKNREGKKAVQIMTIHRAKGCEFDHVYLVHANDKVIPHEKGEIEEERRLAYVAMTRARKTFVLSSLTNLEMSPFAYESEVLRDRPMLDTI